MTSVDEALSAMRGDLVSAIARPQRVPRRQRRLLAIAIACALLVLSAGAIASQTWLNGDAAPDAIKTSIAARSSASDLTLGQAVVVATIPGHTVTAAPRISDPGSYCYVLDTNAFTCSLPSEATERDPLNFNVADAATHEGGREVIAFGRAEPAGATHVEIDADLGHQVVAPVQKSGFWLVELPTGWRGEVLHVAALNDQGSALASETEPPFGAN